MTGVLSETIAATETAVDTGARKDNPEHIQQIEVGASGLDPLS